MSQERPQLQTPKTASDARPSVVKQPWTQPVVVESSCALEINCYAPARL